MAIKEENSVGFRIISAFNAKDLKEVAQTIGENYSSLHNWTAGRRDFPTNVLIKIAKMANVSIDWILTGENNSNESRNFTFDEILSEKIREIIKEEISDGTEIHQKIQGIVLAMQSNVKEQNIFASKEEKAA